MMFRQMAGPKTISLFPQWVENIFVHQPLTSANAGCVVQDHLHIHLANAVSQFFNPKAQQTIRQYFLFWKGNSTHNEPSFW
jgi:hypothetical protein